MPTETTRELDAASRGETKGGGYFVSNYPPFSFWSPEAVPDALAALDRAPTPGTQLGVYIHIPFCRKRCHFCYYKVYTDKNAEQIHHYLDAVTREMRMYAERAFVGGRKPRFVYFGGGTPSYLSAEQLRTLTDGLKAILPWDAADEITFECEPGTLNRKKLQAIRDLGVTRLSLGVEHFDEAILRANNRAHGAKEIDRAYGDAREAGFPQINIDLIAGMLGETEENWRACVRRAIAMEPDSVTVYQMEVPYNTTIYREMKARGESVAPIADWETKRRWVAEAFETFERAGYAVNSAYTVTKASSESAFVYRDSLWTGADMIGLGVSSFGQIGGTHMQNEKDMGPYVARVEAGELPIRRGLTMTDEERLIRELVLQLKLGRIRASYFREKFGIDVASRFAPALGALRSRGILRPTDAGFELSREGLLQVDGLLPAFFLPQHRAAG